MLILSYELRWDIPNYAGSRTVSPTLAAPARDTLASVTSLALGSFCRTQPDLFEVEIVELLVGHASNLSLDLLRKRTHLLKEVVDNRTKDAEVSKDLSMMAGNHTNTTGNRSLDRNHIRKHQRNDGCNKAKT